MTRLFLLSSVFLPILFFHSSRLVGQVKIHSNENVSIGTDSVANSAKLEIHSENKGLLIPRISDTSMVQGPVDGLLVYVQSMDPDVRGFYYWDGGLIKWIKLNYVPGQSAIGVDNSNNIILDLDNNVLSADLTTTGVQAGSYVNTNLSVDQFGRITAAASGVPYGTQGAINAQHKHGPGPIQIPGYSEVVVDSVTITPTDSQSVILVLARLGYQNGGTGNPKTLQTFINRNGTAQIGEGTSLTLVQAGPFGTVDHITQDDDHNSLTPVTYYLIAKNITAGSQVSVIDWEIEVIELIGPSGPMGPQGIPGPQGGPGIQGPQGEIGPVAFITPGLGIMVVGNGTLNDPYIISNTYQDNDNDPTNELQTLTTDGLAGNVQISDPNGGVLNEITININDADYDPTNELQYLTWNPATLTLGIQPQGNDVTLTGIATDPAHLSFSGAPPSIILNSSTGNDVTIAAGQDIDFDLNGNTLTINNAYEDNDNDPVNEIQELMAGPLPGQLTILPLGNQVFINVGDLSNTNEIQHLSLDGNLLSLSQSPDTITLPDGVTNLSVVGTTSPLVVESSTAEPGKDITLHAGQGIVLDGSPQDITISTDGSGNDPGTVVNSVLRWNGTDWVEETSALIDEDGRTGLQGAPLSLDYSLTTSDDILVDSLTVGRGRGGNITTAALGYQVMNSADISSIGNIGIGYKALNNIGMGDYNVSIGYNAQRSHSNGQGNISIGSWSLENLTGNSDNVGVGRYTLQYLINGYDNTAIGAGALWNCQSSDNVGVGCRALADLNVTNKDYNTAIGFKAADSVTSVQYVTALGAYAGYDYATSHSIYIGPNAGNNVAMISNGDSILMIQNSNDPSALISGDFKTNRVGIDLEPKDASRTLDINGELRIRDLETTSPDRLVGTDEDGVISNIFIGENLTLQGDTLSSVPGLFFGDIKPNTLAGLNLENDTITDVQVNFIEPADPNEIRVSNIWLQNDTLYALRGSYFETFESVKWVKTLNANQADTLKIDETIGFSYFDFTNNNGTLIYKAPPKYRDTLIGFSTYYWTHLFKVNVTLSISTQYAKDAVLGIRKNNNSSLSNCLTEFTTKGNNGKENVTLSSLVPLRDAERIAVELINIGGEDPTAFTIEQVNFNAHHIKSMFHPDF